MFGKAIVYGTVRYINVLDTFVLQHSWIYERINACLRSNGGIFFK